MEARKVGKDLKFKGSMKSMKAVEAGLEVPKKVVFKNWEPGGEYTMPLHIKNVKLQTQKVYLQWVRAKFGA